ncbi:TorD/DmsD family molecular chaperone [Trueperella bialowiezensis]|uniref:Twin-argninine leader-binding protein DmsD n=1 Tax=Trueperella bialowiezensis TaxID=312285 RepID=A0A3S4Z5N6_9ACTO|nr:molecular chaperone TorD family protein [Trueperella bialowiezensis]VEI13545.1 twin-argninine leader-binding protein DmsD [Trueperella bialowiezensis]
MREHTEGGERAESGGRGLEGRGAAVPTGWRAAEGLSADAPAVNECAAERVDAEESADASFAAQRFVAECPVDRLDALAAAFLTLGRLHLEPPTAETLQLLEQMYHDWPLGRGWKLRGDQLADKNVDGASHIDDGFHAADSAVHADSVIHADSAGHPDSAVHADSAFHADSAGHADGAVADPKATSDSEAAAELEAKPDSDPVPDSDTADGLRSWAEAFAHGESAEQVHADLTTLYGRVAKAKVPPFESVHRGRDRLVFDEHTFEVRAYYRKLGLQAPHGNKVPDDHVGLEFNFVAQGLERLLVAIEHDALNDAATYAGIVHDFYTDHLSQWAPAMLAQARDEAETEFYRGVMSLSLGALTGLRQILIYFGS